MTWIVERPHGGDDPLSGRALYFGRYAVRAVSP
jgi:hypothetical protein